MTTARLFTASPNRHVAGTIWKDATAGEILVAAALECDRWIRARADQDPDDLEAGGRSLRGAERALDGLRAMLGDSLEGRALDEAELDS